MRKYWRGCEGMLGDVVILLSWFRYGIVTIWADSCVAEEFQMILDVTIRRERKNRTANQQLLRDR